MPRKLRLQYPGAMYHVMSRGDRGVRIFLDDVDRHDFIKILTDAKAQRIMAEELHRHGWCEADLPARRKKDPVNLAMAARLRRETTLSLKAITTRLCLGTSKSANGKLHEFMKGARQKDTPGQLAVTFKLEGNEKE